MSLATSRRSAAAAAIVAFVGSKNPRLIKRDGGASILSPAQNPDLQDDLTDLVADVLIWAREEGLDTAWIARVGASHAEPAHVADDETLDLIAKDGPVALTYTSRLGGAITTTARFNLIEDAERFLAESPTIDASDREAGRYGIDAPHGLGSDLEAAPTLERLGWRLFHSMGGLYAAAPGVATTGNVQGVGWTPARPGETAPALALRLLALIDPEG